MIYIDDNDPVGTLEPSFSPRDVTIKRNVDAKQLYELISEIGRGKFGTVYKCREKSTDLELAAKFVPIPKREDRRNVEREVEIMNSLQHPLIIQLYAAYEYQKMMCVVLELIEGGELFDRVVDDDFVLTERVCTIFMRQVCEGMQFIHRNNILHLDLKPENILCLTKEGNRIKIIDFGLARKYDPDKKLQVLFGTPEFVAPEVVNFDSISYGTDMWSVGVICYVLLSGLSPFMGETDIETMANVTIAKYDFDDEAFNNVSPEALDFISKLLMKDMNSRMTASECLEHKWLERYRKSVPTIQSQNLSKLVTMPPQLQQQEQISNSPPKYIMTPPTPPIITPEQPPPSYSVAVPTMTSATTPLEATKTQTQTKDIQLPSPPSIPSEKSLQQPQPPTPEIQSTLTEELPQPKKSTTPSVIPLTTTKTTTPPQQPSPTSQSPSPSPSPTKNKTELLEQAKDNLKTFIERWEEHPNSPYIFDSGSYLIAPIHLDSSNSATKGSSNVSSRDTISASTSLKKFWKNYSCENQRINEACSPSPCESLCSVFDDIENTQSNPSSLLENKSILDDVGINTNTTTSRKKINSTITPITITATDKNNKDDTNNNINVDDIKSIKSKNIKEYLHSFDRRNSDTNYLLRRRPSSEKVNLAEEIRKLSDHLLMLAAINTKLVKDNEEIIKENQLQQQESRQQQQQPQQPKSRTNSTSDKLETIQESIAISTKTNSNSNQIKEPKSNSSTVKTTTKKSTSVIESPNTSKSTTVSKTSKTTTNSSTTSKSSSKKVSTLSVLLQQSLDETPKLSSNDNDKNKNHKKSTSSSSSSSTSTTTITTITTTPTPKSNNLSVPPTTISSSSSSSSSTSSSTSTSLSSTDRASKLINGFKQQLLSTSTSTVNMISGGSGVPWPITNKRTKFRINQMSRDVPIGSPDTHQPIDLEDAANTTKDCLLHLLEKYNDTNETRKYKNCSIGRHQSISVDWNISDNLENQSMSSINAFFRRHSSKGNYVRQLQAQLEAKSNQK